MTSCMRSSNFYRLRDVLDFYSNLSSETHGGTSVAQRRHCTRGWWANYTTRRSKCKLVFHIDRWGRGSAVTYSQHSTIRILLVGSIVISFCYSVSPPLWLALDCDITLIRQYNSTALYSESVTKTKPYAISSLSLCISHFMCLVHPGFLFVLMFFRPCIIV